MTEKQEELILLSEQIKEFNEFKRAFRNTSIGIFIALLGQLGGLGYGVMSFGEVARQVKNNTEAIKINMTAISAIADQKGIYTKQIAEIQSTLSIMVSEQKMTNSNLLETMKEQARRTEIINGAREMLREHRNGRR